MAAIDHNQPLMNAGGVSQTARITVAVQGGHTYSLTTAGLTEAKVQHAINKLMTKILTGNEVLSATITEYSKEGNELAKHQFSVLPPQHAEHAEHASAPPAMDKAARLEKASGTGSEVRMAADALKQRRGQLAQAGTADNIGELKQVAKQAAAEQKVFSGPQASTMKHALNEFYAAESVFLVKLKELRNDPNVATLDTPPGNKAQLDELISHTESIVTALTAFEQIGGKQAAELRTLVQDYAIAISFAARNPGEHQETCKGLESEQIKIGASSGGSQFSAELAFAEGIEKLRKSESPEAKEIVKKHDRIAVLKGEMKQLPTVPAGGIVQNLTSVLNKDTMKTQYDLLIQFKLKADTLQKTGHPEFSSYQEIVNKITRYPMLVEAMVKLLPKEMQGKGENDSTGLVGVKGMLFDEAFRANTAKNPLAT